MSQTSQDLLSSASQLSVSPASAASGGRKRSGEQLKAYHAPWETAPAHVIDLVNGRSAYGDKPLEKLWEYVSSETSILKWRTECPVYLCLACVCCSGLQVRWGRRPAGRRHFAARTDLGDGLHSCHQAR